MSGNYFAFRNASTGSGIGESPASHRLIVRSSRKRTSRANALADMPERSIASRKSSASDMKQTGFVSAAFAGDFPSLRFRFLGEFRSNGLNRLSGNVVAGHARRSSKMLSAKRGPVVGQINHRVRDSHHASLRSEAYTESTIFAYSPAPSTESNAASSVIPVSIKTKIRAEITAVIENPFYVPGEIALTERNIRAYALTSRAIANLFCSEREGSV